MKKITLLGLLFLPFLLIAQIPSYYNDVNLSLTGTALKDELAIKIINTHTLFLSYSQVWDASRITDLNPNDATQSNVILIYGYNDNDGNYVTDRTRNKNANGGTSGTDWNREHTYARSLGTPNLGTSGSGSDAHHLRPADVTFNGQRGSKKFASGSGNAGNSSGGWYAGDEWKGDIARMMMYMYLRYGNQCLPTNVGIGSSSSTPDAMIDLFLQWNTDDPVSQLEVNRNAYHGNTANTFAQGNRNPFIDNPAFATQIWGGPQAEDLFEGGSTGGLSTELFFSEYVEGSSYNKALEIVNATNSSINLSAYSIKKQSNGAGSWSDGISLNGQLASGAVFVAANSNASSTIIAVADVTSSGSELSFNGNDAVGLFKNGVLIDIIGTFNGGSANFAKDQTLRRKEAIKSPSTTFDKTGEWDVYSQNTFDGLGSHTTSSGNGGTTTDILLEHSFETGWDGWFDGGGDCYRINSSRSFDGNYSIRIRDNSGTASAMTSSSYDITAYDNLEVKFNFYSYSMEYNEDFWLRYYDGSSWHTVQTFARGTDFNNNVFMEATVNISSSSYNFPANAQFRFQCDASSNADQIYIDNVIITATSGGAAKSFSTNNSIISLRKGIEFDNELIEIDDTRLYPNPTTNNHTLLRTELDIEDDNVDVQITVVNIQGRLMKKILLDNVQNEFFEHHIGLSNLKNGLYFINITTSKGFSETKKLILK
ncbi:MAG: endonuclease [Flavobacteriaceae bacterium]|nr:endonuclease [Flavobacteriaceae bacterium]